MTSKLEPTPQQAEAIEKMGAFQADRRQRGAGFLLSGFAGTGKTFSITRLLDRLSGEKVVLTAPTNKAVRVLEGMMAEAGLKVETKTTHALLGLVVQYDQDRQILKRKRKSQLNDYSLVIVDECSMINGELWDNLQRQLSGSATKIIFVGDPAQLPPVNEPESPTFGIDNRVELTDIVRQRAGNPIIELSAAIRETMDSGQPVRVADFVRRPGDKSGVSLRLGDRFADWFPRAFQSERYQKDADAFRVVSWTNRRVIAFNRTIRHLLLEAYPEQPFLAGERAVSVGPVYDLDGDKTEIVLNTDIEGTVRSCERAVHPWFPDHRFQVWKTVFQPANGDDEVTAYLPDDREKRRIDDQLNTLADRAREREISWWSFWKLKNAMADLRPCHAITVHRAQGSTFENVFIDSADILANPNRREALQCLYVAVTRASKNVILNSALI